MRRQARDDILPALTPIRIETTESLSLSGNLRRYAAFLLDDDTHSPLMVIPIPETLPQILFLPTDDAEVRISFLDSVILRYGEEIVADENIRDRAMIRIIRDADLSIDEEHDEDFVGAMQQIVDSRRHSRTVRCCLSECSPALQQEIATRLNIDPDLLFIQPPPLHLGHLAEIADLSGFEDAP